jgi:hypothetical protein
VLIASESKDKKAGFIAMVVVDSICHFSVDEFVKKHLKRGQTVHSDPLPALSIIDQTHHYGARVTPGYLVDEWLPWLHIAIGNLKNFVGYISWRIGKIPKRILR